MPNIVSGAFNLSVNDGSVNQATDTISGGGINVRFAVGAFTGLSGLPTDINTSAEFDAFVTALLAKTTEVSATGINVSLHWADMLGIGGFGNDTFTALSGTFGPATIYGREGNDTITTGSGADTINGGDGADGLDGGGGADIYDFIAGDIDSGEVINDTGGTGVDILRVAGSGTVDFTTASTIAGIEELTFTGTQGVAFNASQLPLSLAVTGANGTFQSIVVLNASDFSAAGWTFTNWQSTDDGIFIGGTNGADTIIGSSQDDRIDPSGGADTLDGGNGSDIYDFAPGTVVDGEIINDTGATGIDSAWLANGSVDFTVANTFAGIEALRIFGAFTATFNAGQLPSSFAITGDGGSQAIVINNASNFDASAWTFASWTAGTDTITISGTSGADTITGTSQDDTLDGGDGADTLDGGDGTADTAIFSGNWLDYTITQGGPLVITDNRGGSPDGTDTVSNVENFTFSNGTFAAGQIINQAPIDIALSNTNVAEGAANGQVVGTLTATDANAPLGDTATFTLLDSAGGRFAISGDSIVVVDGSLLDFETAQSHQVTVRATDANGLFFDETFVIDLTDVNDAPTITSDGGGATASIPIAEGTSLVTSVTAIDPEIVVLTYSNIGGADQELFFIDPNTGALSFNTAPDFESPQDAGLDNIYDVIVQVSDGSLTDTQTIAVSVTDVNDAPAVTLANTATSIAENTSTATRIKVADIVISDDALGTETLALTGLDAALFEIDGLELFLRAGTVLDFEGGNTQLDVTVEVDDPAIGGTPDSTVSLSIAVVDANDAPTTSPVALAAIAEDSGARLITQAELLVNADDADVDSLTAINLAIQTGGGSLLENGDGTWTYTPGLNDNTGVTFSYQVTDGTAAPVAGSATLDITPVNDSPVITSNGGGMTASLSVAENTIPLTTVTAMDADDVGAITFAIAGGDDAGNFIIDIDSGALAFAQAPNFEIPTDLNGDNIYEVIVRASDGNGGMDDQAISVTITDGDDPGVAQDDAFTTAENAALSSNSVFANNGSGPDTDPDGPPEVTAVNGNEASVGTTIALASGALLTLNADGTFYYDPNHAFDALPTLASGASNTPGADSFTYTIAGGDTATATVTITGVDSSDLLLATAGNDVLNGGVGNDTMVGGQGNDTYYVDSPLDVIHENVGEGHDTVITNVSYTLTPGAEVELLRTYGTASSNPINLTGNEFNNALHGNSGANVLNGGSGADAMYGFSGNDTYWIDNPGDAIGFEGVSDGNDSAIVTTAMSWTLAAGVHVETIRTLGSATTYAVNLTGNELANTVVGNSASNQLNGGAGADAMWGYGGNDTYFVDNSGDRVVEAIGGGNDTVVTNTTFQLQAGSEVELLRTYGSSTTNAINLWGNEVINTLWGNSGNNVLSGGMGNDTLVSYGGSDIFYFHSPAEGGDQVLDFDPVNDAFYFNSAAFGVGAGTLLQADVDFVAGTAATTTSASFVYNGALGQLFWDADGTTSNDVTLIATLTTKPSLTDADFFFV